MGWKQKQKLFPAAPEIRDGESQAQKEGRSGRSAGRDVGGLSRKGPQPAPKTASHGGEIVGF